MLSMLIHSRGQQLRVYRTTVYRCAAAGRTRNEKREMWYKHHKHTHACSTPSGAGAAVVAGGERGTAGAAVVAAPEAGAAGKASVASGAGSTVSSGVAGSVPPSPGLQNVLPSPLLGTHSALSQHAVEHSTVASASWKVVQVSPQADPNSLQL